MDKSIDKLFLERRTIRAFASRPVSDDLLNELFTMAARSSTTGNMQLYSAVVTRDPEKKAVLGPAHFNQPAYRNAPAIITFCADFHRFSLWAEQNNAHPDYTNFHSFMVAAIDALIVAQTFCMAAEAKGLGICYLGTTTYNADSIISTLNLPSLVVPVATISLGYPESQPAQTDRLPLASFVHQEEYQEYSSETITDLYAEKESLEENQRFVAENQKEHLAQVFTEVRYTPESFEQLSKLYAQAIERQGFKLFAE